MYEEQEKEEKRDVNMHDNIEWLWLLVVLIGAIWAASWLVFRAYFKSKLDYQRTMIRDLEGPDQC